MIVFGGWANYPVNDQFALNIGKITGPEYAIYGISPILGPLTGRTKCNIKGEGFRPGLNFQVRFIIEDQFLDVPGIMIDENTLTCETPNFDGSQPG